MEKTELSRKFIEAMLRLKRDTIKQAELKLLPLEGLILKIGEYSETTINYVPSAGAWSIFSPKLKSVVWNPLLHEIQDFLTDYKEEDILKSIEQLYSVIDSGYSRIDAKSLLNKFQSILHLLEFEENQKENYELILNTSIGHYNIFYNVIEMKLKVSDESKIYDLDDRGLLALLGNIDYLNATKALNTFYSTLKRKK